MLRAGAEDRAAAGGTLRRKAGAGCFSAFCPCAAGGIVAGTGVVQHQRAVVGVLYGGGALQKLLEQPSVTQHTGQAGHQALSLALAGTGSVDHAVQISAALRAQGQGLDIGFPHTVLLQIPQPGQILILLHKGQQGIVGAHGSHGGGLGHAPRKNFGVLPQIQAVLYEVAFKAVLAQGAVFHLLQKLGLQTLLPHRQVGLHQRRDKGQVSHGQNLPSG